MHLDSADACSGSRVGRRNPHISRTPTSEPPLRLAWFVSLDNLWTRPYAFFGREYVQTFCRSVDMDTSCAPLRLIRILVNHLQNRLGRDCVNLSGKKRVEI